MLLLAYAETRDLLRPVSLAAVEDLAHLHSVPISEDAHSCAAPDEGQTEQDAERADDESADNAGTRLAWVWRHRQHGHTHQREAEADQHDDGWPQRP